MASQNNWYVTLDGVTLSGGGISAGPDTPSIAGCLTLPPDGLGLPPVRTEDVTYPQRDGVRHFSDWYEPRIVTLEEVYVGGAGCDCGSPRRNVREILSAWSRRCDDVELVIWPPDCGDDEMSGPVGIVGRPRVAEATWLPGRKQIARLLLRFDAVDHRAYLLNDNGDPGSGVECVTLIPSIMAACRTYERCYDPDGMCYTPTGDGGGGSETTDVGGTECARLTITLTGALTDPVVENVDTGETLGYSGTIVAGAQPVIIDTRDGTATQGGSSRTHLLTGDTRMTLSPGLNTLRLTSYATTDDGTAEICYRPSVVMV